MATDLTLLGSKLLKYREQLQTTPDEVAAATGMLPDRLLALEAGTDSPSGDELLILADYYHCDYNYFVSGDQAAVFERTQALYRVHGTEFTKEDRWAIQEFLFVCECEESLVVSLGVKRDTGFRCRKRGSFLRGQGQEAAAELRAFLDYDANVVGTDIYADLRRLGMHVFRRRLGNSNISGIFMAHPSAGKCILVNYDEDVYRQRFTAAHEAAHAILDDDEGFVVSYYSGEHDLSEVRANAFASRYLVPAELLSGLSPHLAWDEQTVVQLADRLQVNTRTLAIALKEAGRVPQNEADRIANLRVPLASKADPELPDSLSPRSRQRGMEMLQRGLPPRYVRMCFDAYDQGIISAGRLAEMLMVDQSDLHEIADLHGRQLRHEG